MRDMQAIARDQIDVAIAERPLTRTASRRRLNRHGPYKNRVRDVSTFSGMKLARPHRRLASVVKMHCERYPVHLPGVAAHCRRRAAIFNRAGIRVKRCPAHRNGTSLLESGGEGEIRRAIRAQGGGEEGIRTLDTTFAVWRFSKALPSATRPPLRCRSYDSNPPEGSNRKACAN